MTTKIGLIDEVESWLIRWDFKDEHCRMKASSMKKTDINFYLKNNLEWVKGDRDSVKLSNFCETISENFCRGIDKELKKNIKSCIKN